MPDLVFRQVHHAAADGQVIFQGLDYTVAQGSRLRLDPRGGGGTTTLLRLAAGLVLPEKGEVLLEGVPHRQGAAHHPTLAQGRVGWVPTQGGLVVNLTLLANAALPMRAVRGLGRRAAEAEALLWLSRAGLKGCADRRPHTLDPVGRWLGALARTAACRPAIWLVDRPPASLSPEEAERALALVTEALAPEDTFIAVDGPDGWVRTVDTFCHLSEGQLRPGSAP